MNKNVLVSGVFIIMALLGGYWWGTRTTQTPMVNTEPTATSTEKSTTDSNTQTPNTSVITPTPKVTETPKAPVGKLYTDPNGDFSFRYPENYTYEKEPLVPGEMGGYALHFYSSTADLDENPRQGFTITKRSLDTYQITITDGIGCIYDTEKNSFKIASSFSGRTDCDEMISNKNNNNVIYFSSSVGGSGAATENKSFISESKGIVITLGITKGDRSLISASTKDLIIQSFIFK